MEIKDLQGKLVAVLGYGQEGKAVTAYLVKHGVSPVLFDQRPWEGWSKIEKLEIKKLGLNFIFGPDAFKELAGFEVAFRSPGIRLSNFQFSIFNFQMTSQTKWFFEHCPAKIIGVTGTKGKGTTASLIYEILSENVAAATGRQEWKPVASATPALPKVCLTGNIGKTQPLEILDNLTADDYIVYELSSFQLQDLEKSPHIAVVLMVTSEHLDYHRDQKEYVEAKSAVAKFQIPDDFAVINADFENSIEIGEQGKGKKIFFSRKRTNVDCYVKDGSIVFVGKGPPRLAPSETGRDPSLQEFSIIKTASLQLRGAHNLENVCAAVSVGKILSIDENIIRDVITNFKGLEHRLEFVAEKSGVKFYNDSFSTTPETAIAAIQSFTEPLIIILGGSSKNSDFLSLGETIVSKKNIKTLVLIGEEAPRIKLAIQTAGQYKGEFLEGATSMEEIFDQIKQVASSGDVVVLSPACASFGMFKSYVDRGDQFKQGVKNYSKC